jgi:hypothetical protein
VDHLFQGRFKAVLVDRDSYLLEVCRYVELNPVRAGMVAEPAQWPWSSCAALTDQAPSPPPPWLDRAAVWGCLLGEDARNDALAKKVGRAYADLVAPAIAQHRPGIAAICQRFRVCGVSLPSFRQRVRTQAMAPQLATPHELT